MRAALVLLLVAALAVTPAVAKTKGEARAAQLLDTCEKFASGDVLIVEWATAQGWTASEGQSDTVYAHIYNATKTIEGVGDVTLFGLVETYPGQTLGYCRMDVQSPAANLGVLTLNDLPRLSGAVQAVDGGEYGTWQGAETGRDYLLLASQTADAFALQLTTFTARSAAVPNP
ncbi:hypothetical protein [Devosia sp.]|uniref:hypothetical protein n=1 Tax=Devosia sp. TaxID=1871048 RepID=UPI00326591A4